MQYIVLDMEWNQAWPGSYAMRRLETPIHGEIIQIGAVRVSEDRQVQDEFQVLVRPKYFRKLNRKISSLTGLKDADLKEGGVAFPEAVEAFKSWCGESFVFLTWGFDDIRILKENLMLFHLDTAWADSWYNAQLIFNAQTDGSAGQKALSTALEIMEITPSRPAHDALGDAYHTALICARLDLAKGIANYTKTKEKHENSFQGAELPDCIDRRVFKGFADRSAALESMTGPENICPKCGRTMTAQRWLGQPGSRYMTRVSCPKCGGFLIRIRLQNEEDGTVKVNRLVYSHDSEAARSYDRQIAHVDGTHRRRRHRKKEKQDG